MDKHLLNFNSYVSLLIYVGKCKLAIQTHDFMDFIKGESMVKWIAEKVFNNKMMYEDGKSTEGSTYMTEVWEILRAYTF